MTTSCSGATRLTRTPKYSPAGPPPMQAIFTARRYQIARTRGPLTGRACSRVSPPVRICASVPRSRHSRKHDDEPRRERGHVDAFDVDVDSIVDAFDGDVDVDPGV